MLRHIAGLATACLMLGCSIETTAPYDGVPSPFDPDASVDFPDHSEETGATSGDGGSDVELDAGGDADVLSWDNIPLECGYPDTRYGSQEGDVIEPFLLWTCEREAVSFPQLWCENDATIIHIGAAWCGNCEAETWEIFRNVLLPLDSYDVELVEILIEDMEGRIAGPEICLAWEEHFQWSFQTYIPEAGILAGPVLELTLGSMLPLTVVVDREGVIRIWKPFFADRDLLGEIRAIIRDGTT